MDGMISRAVQNLLTPSSSGIARWRQGLTEFREVRMRTISALTPLSQAQADSAPAPGKWSIAQNADHILLSEKFYRAQIARLITLAREGRTKTLDITFAEVNPSFAAVPVPVLSALSVPLTLMNMFVPGIVRQSVIRYPLFPALSPTVMEPVHTPPIDELLASMHSSIAATEALFAGTLPESLDSVAISHPLLGRNSVGDIFGLMGAHEQRHLDQIARIRAQTKST